MNSLRNLWNSSKRSDIHIIESQKKKENRAENLSNLLKHINPQIQKPKYIPNEINRKKYIPRHFIIKLLKIKVKEKILK